MCHISAKGLLDLNLIKKLFTKYQFITKFTFIKKILIFQVLFEMFTQYVNIVK